MVFCVKCGADNNPATTRFCRACGAPLPGMNPAVSAPLPSPPAPSSGPVKKKGHPVLWVLLILFAAMVVWASLNRSDAPPKTKPVSAPLLPTPRELQDAEKAGLSKEFATKGWIHHRYALNKYVPLTGLSEGDEGLTIPPDEVLRTSLVNLNDVVQTDADRLALRRMRSLLWATHTAVQLKSRGTEDPTYKQVFQVADHCFMAVSVSFNGGTGGAAANGVRSCLTEQVRVKDELDKRGVSNWDTP
jgi:zinc ribbon protein